MENYLAYVGIDFGTSGITFSYSFDVEKDKKMDIQVKKWEGLGTANKTTTEIILDKNLEDILAFGKNECHQMIHNGIKDGLHFSNIKMNLYKDQLDITDNSFKGKFKLEKVISKFLEKIRDEAIKELQSKKIDFQKLNLDEAIKKIKWILTVPAIWSDKSKDCMLKAAKLARLIKDDEDPSNFFALEPEAAACNYVMSNEAEEIELNSPYIICDLGGGTADITTHERILDKNGNKIIAEIYPPTGGAHGSREINEFIMKKLIPKEVKERIEEILKEGGEESEELQSELRNLENDINEFKHLFTSGKINEKHLINIEVLKSGFKDKEPELEELVNNFNNDPDISEDCKISIKNKKKWILNFPYKIIYYLIKKLIVDETIKYINEIINYLRNSTKNKKEIKTIILVGGMSANHSILELFQEALPDISIVSMVEPEIAVVKGAIYFAKNPYSISQRMARYSIGIQSVDLWQEKFEKIKEAQKVWVEKYNEFNCFNTFSPFYKKFNSINVLGKGKYQEFDMFSNHCKIEFYKSDYNGPVYIVGQLDENGKCMTEKFGNLEFEVDDFDEKEPALSITVKLGGTFIVAEIEYLKTKKKSIHTFSFE